MLVAREIGSPARSRLEVLGAGSETSRDTAEGDENRDESLGLPSTVSLPRFVTLAGTKRSQHAGKVELCNLQG